MDNFDDSFAKMKPFFNDLLANAGFDKIAYEDFLEESFTLIAKHWENIGVLRAAGEDPSEWLASEWRTDPLGSNTMVIVFRMLVSAYLQANADDYIPFIYDSVDPSLESKGSAVIMADYCRRHVEAIGVESDQIDVIAITKILGCSIEIVYLDASRSQDNMVMKFEGEAGGILSGAACITLLYRPGHYDIIYHE